MRTARVIAAIGAALVAVAFVIPSTSAASTPKATGSVGLASPMQYVSFNAFDYGASGDRGTVQYTNFEFAVPGTGVWMMGGGGTLDVELGGQYLHTMIVDSVTPVSPTRTLFGGHGFYNPGGYDWTLTGMISGSNVAFEITYTTGLPGYVFSATGTIAPDGSMSGTATDTLLRNSTWSMPAGTAHEVFSYTAPVTNVVVSGNQATFEFAIPAGLPSAGFNVHVAVSDGGSPGAGHDTWAHEGQNYPIVSGNLVVHN